MNENRELPDAADRPRGITVISEIRPFRYPFNRLTFALARLWPATMGIDKVSLLYFARWSVLRSIPYNGPPQVRERLRHPLLIFEDYYNGLTDPYIEAFARVLRLQILFTWGTSYGYTGTRSVVRFTRQIKKLLYPGSYDYSAYPTATVRMIKSALAVAREHRYLREAARTSSPEDFAVVYRGFLTRRQEDL
jgi:hypothetical protein